MRTPEERCDPTRVDGVQIQWDASNGAGHCWRNVEPKDIPAEVLGEIMTKIMAYGEDDVDRYLASNGQYYRW